MSDAARFQYQRPRQRPRRRPRHRYLKWSVILVVSLVVLLGVITGAVEYIRYSTLDYSSIKTTITVAEICAVKTPTSRPTMDVHVILYKNDGSSTAFDLLLQGDHVQVQGDIIKYWSVKLCCAASL